MRVLALQPYDGGSHRAFLDGWRRHSEHQFTVWTQPAHHWKWRMRQAAATFAQRAHDHVSHPASAPAPEPDTPEPPATRATPDHNPGPTIATPAVEPAAATHFDALWTTSMLDLAALRGLGPPWLARLPAALYFHENQAAYPDPHRDRRDVHFPLTQLLSATAALRSGGAVGFNSAHNRDTFFAGMAELLKKMPGRELHPQLDELADRAQVWRPGVELEHEPIGGDRGAAPPGGSLRIVWAARWDHDKGPGRLADALDRLVARGVEFRLSVLGETFQHTPDAFGRIERDHAGRIDRWGYQPTRAAYERALAEADVFVSTASHEFFGLSALEAALAGCYPVLPRALAYPEVFDAEVHPGWFYDPADPTALADRLTALAADRPAPRDAVAQAQRHRWRRAAGDLDAALAGLFTPGP